VDALDLRCKNPDWKSFRHEPSRAGWHVVLFTEDTRCSVELRLGVLEWRGNEWSQPERSILLKRMYLDIAFSDREGAQTLANDINADEL
jgi:hypothetical protein